MLFAQIGEQIFGLLAGYLKPEGIGAEIKFARPRQDTALLADVRTTKKRVIAPWRKYTFTYLGGKIHFAFDAVFEAQPNAIAVEDVSGYDLHHAIMITRSCRAAKSGRNPGRPSILGTHGLCMDERHSWVLLGIPEIERRIEN